MIEVTNIAPELRRKIDTCADQLLTEYQDSQWRQTDHLFAVLLVLQWLACVVLAVWISPRAWDGLESHIHPHIWAAVFLGGLIAAGPIALVIVRPGEAITRYVIAAAQMMHSALLIHLSGGRIETHFHVFGSLAFLASIAIGACWCPQRWWSQWTTRFGEFSGRNRCLALSRRVPGGGWNMPAGLFSRTSFWSGPVCGARKSWQSLPPARRNWRRPTSVLKRRSRGRRRGWNP